MDIEFKVVTGTIRMIGSSVIEHKQHVHTVLEVDTPTEIVTLQRVHVTSELGDYLRPGDEVSMLFSKTNDSSDWYLQAVRLEDGRYVSYIADHKPWYLSGTLLLASLFFGFIVGVIPYIILAVVGVNARTRAVEAGVEAFKTGLNPSVECVAAGG